MNRMASEIQCKPLCPTFGLEVSGLDLSQALCAAVIEELRARLVAQQVLCVRDQQLTERQPIDFTQQRGPLENFPEENKTATAASIYRVANVSTAGEHLPETDHRVVFQKVNALIWPATAGCFGALPSRDPGR